MKFEHQCQYDYDRYPILFQRRWQLLNQYFCVIGNGFEWVDGELKEVYDHKPIENYTPVLNNGKAYRSEEDIYLDIRTRYEKVYKNHSESTQKLIDQYKDSHPHLVYDLINQDEKIQQAVDKEMAEMDNIQFYPLSSSSKLFAYPEDIKPDWLDAIKETVQLLLIHGHGYTEPADMNDWQKEQRVIHDEKLALLAKELGVTA